MENGSDVQGSSPCLWSSTVSSEIKVKYCVFPLLQEPGHPYLAQAILELTLSPEHLWGNVSLPQHALSSGHRG